MPKHLSLYTGAGGLDLGLEAAGFNVAVAVESSRASCETLRANRRFPLHERDIHEVSSDELMEAANCDTGEIDLLVGGPPCQPFSKAAYWAKGDTKRLDDPRADTLTAYLRVLRDTQPKAFLLENVVGLAFKGKDEGLRLLTDTIAAINRQVGTGYQISWKVLNAANYGVPQIRERVFLVGSRDGKQFVFPEETHARPESLAGKLFDDGRAEWCTAWDAIGDLEPPEEEDLAMGGRWANLLPSIPEGQNYLFHTDRGDGLPLFGWRRRYWSFLLKLSKRLPSWTIQAQPGSAVGPFHWKNRKLSTRELCRLQTFPDNYDVVGGRTDIQNQLGNAVPSLLGEILGKAIRRQFFGTRVSKKLKLAVKKCAETPRAELVRKVPKEYRDLIGDHAAHPGTGKGHLVRGK